MSMSLRLKASRYNFFLRENKAVFVLFNAASGSVIKLEGDLAELLVASLMKPTEFFSVEELAPDLANKLRLGGFLVEDWFNELQSIKERYWRARGETPVVLTITTTMNCNLGCYYCYEERSSTSLEIRDVDAIVELAKHKLAESQQKSLHVDWYGGEPLLNLSFLEAASAALQKFCEHESINYVASIISNGSEWPADAMEFVNRNRIRQVQISFDGLKTNHDKRRRYRKGYGDSGISSFLRAVELVDKLVNVVRVDLRFNIDRRNQDDLVPFIQFSKNRGWFDATYPAVFQPARLAAYSSSSMFMRDYELSLEEFDSLRAIARSQIGMDAKIEESEVPDGVPRPKSSVCAALAAHSVVIGAEALTYRCGLQVGEKQRAVGAIMVPLGHINNSEIYPDASWWDNFDPTMLPNCSKCSFLPICWGGCPKKHLENDEVAIKEQSVYWRTNLPRLISTVAKIENFQETVFPESLQFR